MQRERRVQVVLGEAERADGLLRFVLEAEGFDLVGMASNDEELSRVLRGAKPSVLVLDGGISAAAALDARQRIDGAALVVVWPDGVSAVLAEERVEPHMVIEDLGDAVRRAAARVERADTIVVPEAETPVPAVAAVSEEALVETEPQPPLPQHWRRRGRVAQVLVAAATWLLVITAFTAIAAAVPHVVDTFRGKQNAPRPTSAPPTERPPGSTNSTNSTGSTVTQPNGPEISAQPGRCDDQVTGADRAADEGSGNAQTQGCPKDRATTPKGSGDGGKPGDAGSQGAGDGSTGVPPEEPASEGVDDPPPDDQGDQGEDNDDQGNQGQGNGDQGNQDDQGNQGQGNGDKGKQGEGNGSPGVPPDQTDDQVPQEEAPAG